MSGKNLHTCVMAPLNEIELKQDYCTKMKPCQMPYHKVKMHYLIHYVSRGTWNHIVPEQTKTDKVRIGSYICKACGRTFKNSVEKNEYEGRGSFLCHYANYHGKIIEALKNETAVGVYEVLEILKETDPTMKKFIEEGTDTAADENPVEEKESLMWSLRNESSGSASFNARLVNPNGVESRVQSIKQSKPASTKKIVRCPHCNEMDKNKDLGNLRLHIIHHYHDYWEGKLPDITRKEINCNKCCPSKRIAGANPAGCKTALICHLALQHEQLKDALNEDKNLPIDFVDNLYANGKSIPSYGPKILQSNRASDVLNLAESALKAGREKFAADIDNRKKRIERELKLTEAARKREERLAEKYKRKIERLENIAKKEENRRKKAERGLKSLKRKQKLKNDFGSDMDGIQVPEIKEQPYIRKRIKQNLKNVCFNDDSDNDGDWELKKYQGTKRSRSPSDDPLHSEAIPLKVLPKRRASVCKVRSLREVDSDEDWFDY